MWFILIPRATLNACTLDSTEEKLLEVSEFVHECLNRPME